MSNLVSKVVGDKRRWRAYKARSSRLPSTYRIAVEAIERYLMCFGPTNADSAASMFEDLADLFEQASADGTPLRDVVGEDPVEFVETFLRNYTKGGWVTREQERLIDGIRRAEEGATRS
jgi:DNA-binding ferritin-like protein (Dps family)